MGSTPSESSPKLKVAIVGAGISGLLAARVLRTQHLVTVYERFPGGHEHGAAINLSPGATKILDNYGLDRERAGAVVALADRAVSHQGQVLVETDMSYMRERFGSDWLFMHRVDLWNELLRLATAPSGELGIEGEPANVSWNKEVVNVDVETGRVKLADGSTVEFDLVVGADGIKSVVRRFVIEETTFRTARSTGFSAFRFTLSRSSALEVDPNLRLLDRSKPALLEATISTDGSRRGIVAYPCRNFELLNMVCLAKDETIGLETTDSWSAEGDIKDLLRVFHDFYPTMQGILRRAKNIKLWQLRDQDPLPIYVKGRAVLIGDAAHAMTPHQGQGATQAIEDAEGFTLFNNPDIDRSSVPSILVDFDRVRRPRATRIQGHTRTASGKPSAEAMHSQQQYHSTYPGIRVCLDRLNEGLEMIDI